MWVHRVYVRARVGPPERLAMIWVLVAAIWSAGPAPIPNSAGQIELPPYVRLIGSFQSSTLCDEAADVYNQIANADTQAAGARGVCVAISNPKTEKPA